MKNQKSDYSKKLLDPRWQKKRLEILNRDNWCCQICGDDQNTLHVHHRRYIPNREPWDIPNELLATLCAACHESETNELEPAVHDLVAMVKEKFFSSSVQQLAEAFHALEIHYECGVTASVIKYHLCDKDRYLKLEEEYFKYLSEKGASPF